MGLSPLPAPSPTSSATGPSSNHTTKITIKILVPASTQAKLHMHPVRTAASAVRPNYVAPTTAKVSVTVKSGSTTIGPVTSSVQCTGGSCFAEVTLSAPTNATDTFTVIGSDASGAALEDGSVTQLVPEGLTTINMSLGGVVNTFESANICPISTPACGQSYQVSSSAQTSWAISVTGAQDIDGNTIVGDYDTPILLAMSEADISQKAFVLNPATLASSTSLAELTYVGSGSAVGFDGEDAPSVAIVPEGCHSNGSPATVCTNSSAYFENLYAVLEAPCSGSVPVCSSYGAYGTQAMGVFSAGGAGVVGSNIYEDDLDTVFDSVSTSGIVAEQPANFFQLLNEPNGAGIGSLVPPLSLNASNSPTTVDVATGGSTLYFNEGLNLASYDTSAGKYAEYPAAAQTSNDSGGGVVASDGNYYEGEGFSGAPFLLRFVPSTQAFSEYTLTSGDEELWITALGANIWFGTEDFNGNFYVGFMPLTQSPSVNVPKSHEIPIGKMTTGDPWTITEVAAAPAGGNLPNGAIFFCGIDTNGTTPMVGSLNPSTHAVSIYPLPSTWPSSPVAGLTAIAYNAVDGYFYFTDDLNGIVGRIPAANPSTATIAGFGPKFNEFFGTFGSGATPSLFADSTGNVWMSSQIPAPVAGNSYNGLSMLTPALATWSASPQSGIAAFKGRLPVRVRSRVRHNRYTARPRFPF